MRTKSRRGEVGASAVEFALVTIPVFTILFGLIQYGLYFYSAQTGSSVANSTVRQLAVGNCRSDTTLTNYVNTQLGGAKDGGATVHRDYVNPNGLAPLGEPAANVLIGGNVKLTISFPTINMHFPFVPFLSNPTIVRTVEARIEDTTEEGCGYAGP